MEPVTGIEPVTPDYKSGALPTKLYRQWLRIIIQLKKKSKTFLRLRKIFF